ncbi:unnamed protein product, partial [Meganyctiphanes norvegica]
QSISYGSGNSSGSKGEDDNSDDPDSDTGAPSSPAAPSVAGAGPSGSPGPTAVGAVAVAGGATGSTGGGAVWRQQLPQRLLESRPSWSRLYKKHKKGIGSDSKDEDESSGMNEVVTWSAPSIPTVTAELLSRISPQSVEAFTALFNNPSATGLPTLPNKTHDMMGNFTQAVYNRGLNVPSNMNSPRVCLMVWNTTAYTIRTLEETQRNSNRALLTSMPNRQKDCLGALIKVSAYVCMSVRKKHVESGGIRLLSILLEGGEALPCVLELDAFSTLVTLVLSLPSILPGIHATAIGSTQDLYLLQLCFLAHLVQLLLTYHPQRQQQQSQQPQAMDVDGAFDETLE